MHIALYIFFSTVSLFLFFLGLYDWGLSQKRIAGFPTLTSVIISLVLFGASWNLKCFSGGVELSALSSWESYAFGCIWALFAFVGIILALTIFLTPVHELTLSGD